jgi:carbamoyltransferase
MRIIGISGLGKIVGFKRSHWPGLDERDYSISPGNDAAAVLVVDGELVAGAREESFSHRPHTRNFPVQAIQYCLSEEKLGYEDIDLLVHSYDYSEYEELYLEASLTAELYRTVLSKQALLDEVTRNLPNFPENRVEQVPHQLAHAASAYFISGWDKGLVLVADSLNAGPTVTAYHAQGSELKEIQEIFEPNSIGIFFGLVAMHLGLEFSGAQDKLIDLSRNGDPERFRPFFNEAIELRRDGTVLVTPLWLNKTRKEREFYLGTRRYLVECLGPARKAGDEITQTHRDIAAGLQDYLVRVMLHVCRHLRRVSGLPRIALAGDVALNYQVNASLMQAAIFDEIFISPAPGNDGSALGAALLTARKHRESGNGVTAFPYYGPGYSRADVATVCRQFANVVRSTSLANLNDSCCEAARLLADGKTIAWYRGRMEFGPFALGHRNILAVPGSPSVRHWMEDTAKKSGIVPSLGVVVSAEEVHLWADLPPGTRLPYMNTAARVRNRLYDELSDLLDSQGRIRFQTVDQQDNPDFHQLLTAVLRVTGRALLLSASLQSDSGLIIRSPREALEAFLEAKIDYLFPENQLVSRKLLYPPDAPLSRDSPDSLVPTFN